MTENYKISRKKPDGKWWGWGSLKRNQYGNLQVSFKNTPEFREMIAQAGEWLNFSCFDANESKTTSYEKAKGNGYQPQQEEESPPW
jgi:hypothetical protein